MQRLWLRGKAKLKLQLHNEPALSLVWSSAGSFRHQNIQKDRWKDNVIVTTSIALLRYQFGLGPPAANRTAAQLPCFEHCAEKWGPGCGFRLVARCAPRAPLSDSCFLAPPPPAAVLEPA